MGREIKRVPLDFDFPLDKSYAESIIPEHRKVCTTYNPTTKNCGCSWSAMTNPPMGPGWQLWQTVDDGPISPVFKTVEELIEWMSQPVPIHKRPSYEPAAYPKMPWAQGWQKDIAENFVKNEGWAASSILSNGRWMSGAEFALLNKNSK